MKAVIWIGLSLAILIGPGALAENPQFEPLTTYLQQDISKDPVALGYVAIRCSALYLVFAAMLAEETDSERQQVKALDIQASEKFQNIALKMEMARTTTTLKDAGRRVSQTLTTISLLYNERIKKAKALTNNMFSDPLITSDFSACKTLLNSL
jgi:hypothetical protein